jgi:gliding motility-associated lipoprotein GldH
MSHLFTIFRFFIFIVVFFTILVACDDEKIFESNVAIPPKGWHRDELARFSVEISDTISPCNVYINIRNTNKYKYMDFWLFVTTSSPSGGVERDTIKIQLANHRGKWLGHGLGSKFDNRIFLRRNVIFPTSGTYIYEYEQAMRDEVVIGIDDIGLRIERVNIEN